MLQSGAGLFNGQAYGRHLVRGQIVHDDYYSLVQLRLLDMKAIHEAFDFFQPSCKLFFDFMPCIGCSLMTLSGGVVPAFKLRMNEANRM